jgi:hypothetical protein
MPTLADAVLPPGPQIYNRRLDERERRRQFVLDRGLLNVKRQQAIDKRRSAAERELHGSLRVLARHLAQDQHEALTEGVAVSAGGRVGRVGLGAAAAVRQRVQAAGPGSAAAAGGTLTCLTACPPALPACLQIEQRLRARIAELQEYRAMVGGGKWGGIRGMQEPASVPALPASAARRSCVPPEPSLTPAPRIACPPCPALPCLAAGPAHL